MKRVNVMIGVRLCIASLILFLGMKAGQPLAAAVLAAIVMKMPSLKFSPRRGLLLDGPEPEVALLEKIKTQNEDQLKKFKSEFSDLANQARSGMIDKATFDAEVKKLTSKLESFDAEKFKTFQETLEKYSTKLEEQKEATKTISEELKKIKDGGAGEGGTTPLRAKLKEILASDSFKEFVDSNGKRKASFEVKAVSITSDYTGGSQVHITTRDGRVVDHPKMTRLNVRDLLTVAPTDLPYLAFIEVYEWVHGVSMNSENGTLSESAFKIREATTDVKRIGTSLPISKRMLRSVAFLENHLATRLPALVRYFEDFQLLWGDGAGNNLTGIFKVARDFTTIVNTSASGVAGSIASVESYDEGTKAIITFTANQEINNGDVITIAGATAAAYNAAHKSVVIGPRQVMLPVAYVAEATAAWTFTVASRFKTAIAFAQEIDVLKVAKSFVTRQEYSATGIVMHPDDAVFIETLKGNDEHYLDVQRLENGVLRIAGVPVVETTAMPSGKFAIGDWAMAAALLEFTSLVLEFSESTQEKLANSVMAIIQEEVIFPIYNKYMFVTGDFATAKAAILKP